MNGEWLDQVNWRIEQERARRVGEKEATLQRGFLKNRLAAAYMYLRDQFPDGSPQWLCYGHVVGLLRSSLSLQEVEQYVQKSLDVRRRVALYRTAQGQEQVEQERVEIETYEQVLADMHLQPEV